MKALLVSALLGLVPVLVLAQSAPAPSDTATPVHKKAAVKHASQKTATKTVVKTKHVQKAESTSHRARLKTKANQMASGVRAADEVLGADQLAIAQRVYVGDIPCELGEHVKLAADPAAPGYFQLDGKGFRYRMSPVTTTTGAVRLEDKVGGAVWLQIANKSMLMDQKHGQRLADDCMSPAQVAVAEELKKSPVRSLLDAPAK